MDIVEAAEQYIAINGLKGRTPIHHCTRWVRMTGIVDARKVTAESIQSYRDTCQSHGYSPKSIEGSINDVVMIAATVTGVRVDVGKRLRIPRPVPKPTSRDDISRIYHDCPAWVRQWLALAYWTGLRLEDSLRLQRDISGKAQTVIRWQASKTGHQQSWPVPEWINRHLIMQVVIPPGKTYCHLQDNLRSSLTDACSKSAVPRILPKHIRQRSITAWKTADATAGSIIHGSGLGILDHYVDPLTILTAAAPKVKLPDCFGAGQDMPDVVPLFSRLDPAGQQLILSTMERLA